MSNVVLCSGNTALRLHYETGANPPSEVYSSTGMSSRAYGQNFIYGPDPDPGTDDWMHFIHGFDPTRYSAWRMTAFATSVYDTSVAAPYPPDNLVFRAVVSTDGTMPDWATIPVDGWGSSSAGPWTVISSVQSGGNYVWSGSAVTPKLPMDVICSAYTGTVSAAFGQWIGDQSFFNPRPGLQNSSELQERWESGGMQAPPEGCFMSGAVELWPYGNYGSADGIVCSSTGG